MSRITPQMQYEAEVYRDMLNTLNPSMAPLVSSAPNAKYGVEDILKVSLCMDDMFVAPAVRKMRRRNIQTMTGQRFLQILRKPDQNEMLDAGVNRLKRSGRVTVQPPQWRAPSTILNLML